MSSMSLPQPHDLHLHPHPLVLELNRFQNLLKEKENELGVALSEIKALRATEAFKEKAIEELKLKHDKLDENLSVTHNVLEHKNLEIKKLVDEKKQALAAQFAAEAALRRLHANQKDDHPLPIESIIAPLQADIKMYKNEIASLLEDKKSLERLTKSKEAALIETERILRSALERALIVEDIQNHNLDLRRQLEICQEENTTLEKSNRKKVIEVEKLSQTIRELEEALLAGGAAANVVRDYERQISELREEKRILERELARARVSANRVATVVANEWKDENDKVMPVKQWLEERRLLQAEMQRIKDKLAVTERTARAEAQLKEKFKLRLNTLEESLKHLDGNVNYNKRQNGTPKAVASKSNQHILGFGVRVGGGPRKRCSSQPGASAISSSRTYPLAQHPNTIINVERANTLDLEEKHALGGDNDMRRRCSWASEGITADCCGNGKENSTANTNMNSSNSAAQIIKQVSGDDVVSGFLYDRLQKQVINLRKACLEKDDGLTTKEEEIKMLQKKVDALTRATEVEARKSKKETSTVQKEMSTLSSTTKDDHKKQWGKSLLKRVTKSS